MEQLLEILKHQRKEVLQWLVLELMRADKLSFAEIAELHVQYLEQLKKGETEKLMKLRGKVISLWSGTKKKLPASLVSLMQEAKDAGWANITQEQIDNSKWNKL
jgi:DNA-directed RNA polymerase subunit F